MEPPTPPSSSAEFAEKNPPRRTVYATYFDTSYLARALTLIESLRRKGDQSQIFTLCLDDLSHSFLTREPIPGVIPVRLQDILDLHPRLQETESQRSRTEFIFTIGPTFLSHIVKTHLNPQDVLVYLDADLYFFGSPKVVLDAMSRNSVGIIEHRYSTRQEKKLGKYGQFNVGWVGFKNDAEGNAVLNWWAERCLEWCSDTPLSDGRYADQGYLNSFPNFEGVSILKSAGFNLAPWNTDTHEISENELGLIELDGDPLIFFHFHGVRETQRWYVTSQLVYGNRASRLLMQHVYKPYLVQLHRNELKVRERLAPATGIPTRRGKGVRGAIFAWQKRLVTVMSMATGNAFRKRSLLR